MCKVELYADDMLMYFASNTINNVESQLTSDLDNVISWLCSNFLTLNLSKTKVILLGTSEAQYSG